MRFIALFNYPQLQPLHLMGWSGATVLPLTPGLSCGTMQVSLNWANPHQGTITFGITRFRSTNLSQRIGNLFANFGGPGVSAAPWVQMQALGTRQYFTPTLLKHFDLIGLDPRGIGISLPIKCDPGLWNERPTWFRPPSRNLKRWWHATKRPAEAD